MSGRVSVVIGNLSPRLEKINHKIDFVKKEELQFHSTILDKMKR